MFGAPAYEQVAQALRKRISSGQLPLGSAIPSTRELCTEFGVSATSVRSAVAQLRTEGLVRGQAGKGVFVIATPQAVKDETAHLDEVVARVSELEGSLDRQTDELRQEFRTELAQIRKLIGQIQGDLINLRGRVGQPVGRDENLQQQRVTGTEAHS